MGYLQMDPQGLIPLAEFDTKDGVYDCAWSEVSFIQICKHSTCHRTIPIRKA